MERLDETRQLVNRYLAGEIHEVKGWCLPQVWQVIWPLSKEIGAGAVAEIGIFQGKFFIGLSKTFATSSENPAAAIDVFELQEFNLDHSGTGDLAAFQGNLDRFGPGIGAVTIVQTDSLALDRADAEALIARHGRFSFFSVDGCHDVVHTVKDVEFAMSVTAHNGVIAVDDYLNPDWPGVAEAMAKMYLMGSHPFVPLAFCCGKLFLCSLSYHARYLEIIHSYIAANHPETRMKRVPRFGFDTLSVHPNRERWSDLA